MLSLISGDRNIRLYVLYESFLKNIIGSFMKYSIKEFHHASFGYALITILLE
jgi:hypothetical protein